MCEACGGTSSTPIAHKRALTILRCASCGLAFVWPQPPADAVRGLYAGNADYAITRQPELAASPDTHARDLDLAVRPFVAARGTLLDVGCSTGSLMYHLRALGWSVEGVDLNEASAAIARRHGLTVHTGPAEEFDTGTAFDVVHMGDVIEHVPSPRRLLDRIRRVTAPGGIVVIETPDAGSNFARLSLRIGALTGQPWAHAEAPMHLFEFSAPALARLLEAAGFTMRAVTRHGRMPFAYAVGASGRFDALKQASKRTGRYRVSRSWLPQVPALAGVSLALAPGWLAAALLDRLNGRRYKMRVIAERTDHETRHAGHVR
jgi:2-polyprenyl-3-methyl-5-hydroxy-6-metoxy-1,4-benzoquinol methylase